MTKKILYPTKCECCKEIFENVEIHNYTVRYEDWEAYNCCSKKCAEKKAKENGITDIINIEGYEE